MVNVIRRAIPPSGIRIIFDRAAALERAGEQILHLDIGRPVWKLPPGVVDAAKQAMDDGFVHYIANRGDNDLREGLAASIFETTKQTFDSDQEIIVTTGASEALSMAGLALLDVGDEVIIPQPAWNHYEAVARLAGASPIPLALSASDGFILDPTQLAAVISPRTRMIIINSPSNPTGAVQPANVLKEVAALAVKNGIFIFSDEIYDQFVFSGEHASIAQFLAESELLLYVNSFSKSYAMTGWRIGYIAARPRIAHALNCIHQYLTVCGVPFAQKAAAQLLRSSSRQAYVEEMRADFSLRRSVWIDGMKGCDVMQFKPPAGAFYLFPRINYRGMSGRQFCEHLLEDHQIACVPGDVFGEQYGDYVRISYGGDLETQRAAVGKIRELANHE